MSKRAEATTIVEAAVGDVFSVKRENAWRGFDLTPEHAASNLFVRVSVGWDDQIIVALLGPPSTYGGEEIIARVDIKARMEFDLAVTLTAQAIEAMLAEIASVGTLAGDVTARQLEAADERTKRAFRVAQALTLNGELHAQSSMWDLPLDQFVTEFNRGNEDTPS